MKKTVVRQGRLRGFEFPLPQPPFPRILRHAPRGAFMEAVNIQFAPETGTEEEWNEAYARLADYFRSYQL